MIRAILILSCCIWIFAIRAGAADTTDGMVPLESNGLYEKVLTPGALPPTPLTVNKLLQRDVLDPQGVKLARLDELIMDNAGEVRYAILSYGGLLDVGEQHILVPWRVLSISSDPTTITLDLTHELLERAPRIDKQLGKRNLEGVNWRDVDRFYIKLYAARKDNKSRDSEFRLLDSDRDRYISQIEARQIPALAKMFKRMDVNHDGHLDQGEFARFESIDTPSPRRESDEGRKEVPSAQKQPQKGGD